MGLAIALDQFSFHLSSKNIGISFSPERGDESSLWHLWQISPTDLHRVSLAIMDKIENCPFEITIRRYCPQLSIEDCDFDVIRGSDAALS